MSGNCLAPDLSVYRNILSTCDLYGYLGKIDKIIGMTVEATGIECNIGDVCKIHLGAGKPEIIAEVVGFRGSKVLMMPYQDIEGIDRKSVV